MWTNRCLSFTDSYEYRNCYRKDNADKANDDESSLSTLPITKRRLDKDIILQEKKYPDEGKYNHNDNDNGNNSSDECSSDDTNYPVRKMQLKSYYETIKSEIYHAEDETNAQQQLNSSYSKKSHLKVSFDV